MGRGWGGLSKGSQSHVLLHGSVLWIPDDICQQIYGRRDDITITKRMICAGDSGGPMTWKDPETSQVKLIGVISWGAQEGCGKPGFPGVYSEVASVLPWVKRITQRQDVN